MKRHLNLHFAPLAEPVFLVLQAADEDGGVALMHTIHAGFRGVGKILDALSRLCFSTKFSRAMDEHAQSEFPMLGAMLSDRLPGPE